MNEVLDKLTSRWSRLGVAFGGAPSPETPDIERLLLETASHGSEMARLFIMAATWLHRYGDLVAKHRLKRLARDELDPEFQPVLGLLLDIAQQGTHPAEFQAVIRDFRPADIAVPLFAVERGSNRLAARAERRASSISRKWGLWCEPFDFKFDALRPPEWVMKQDADFVTRADMRGDLRSSVLASLRCDPASRESEMSLARFAGGSRAQIRASLSNLELSGRVRRERSPGTRRTAIHLLHHGSS